MLITNTTYTRAIGDTSHYALLGYDPRGPLDELEDVEEAKLWKPESRRKKQIGVLRQKVKSAIEKSTGTTHKWVNQKRKKKHLKIGDRIFTKQNTGRKLHHQGGIRKREPNCRGRNDEEDAAHPLRSSTAHESGRSGGRGKDAEIQPGRTGRGKKKE